MFTCFVLCNKNSVEAVRMYNNTYPDRIQPTRTFFHKLKHNVREYGAFLKPKRSVPKVITINENIQIPILAYVEFMNKCCFLSWRDRVFFFLIFHWPILRSQLFTFAILVSYVLVKMRNISRNIDFFNAFFNPNAFLRKMIQEGDTRKKKISFQKKCICIF